MRASWTPRIALGGIRYETNSFVSPGRLDLSSLRRASEVLQPLPSTEMAGAVSVGRELGAELTGLLDVFAGCGGPADHDQFSSLVDSFVEELSKRPNVDGVYLALHGAMATTRIQSADAMLVSAVRVVVGPEVPIVASFDLHAAVDDQLVAELDGIVGFKTCPHADYEATGRSAMQILDDAVRDRTRPMVHRSAVPLVTPAESHDTSTGPLTHHMADAVARIGGEILDVSIFAVQPWLDAHRTSWAVTVTYNAPVGLETARRIASEIRDRLLEDVSRFVPDKVSPVAAARLIEPRSGRSPLLVADSGDSPSAGSSGGSTDLLAQVVESTGEATVLATITDSGAATLLRDGRPGLETEMSIGGVASLGIDPLELSVRLLSVHDGRYERGYPAAECDVGVCAVVTYRTTTLVVTERPAFMLDMSLFDHVGLNPGEFDAVLIKSAGGFRDRWARVSDRIVTVETRGASTSRLASLPYQFVDRSTFVSTDHYQPAPIKDDT